jgi:hypothetical protein
VKFEIGGEIEQLETIASGGASGFAPSSTRSTVAAVGANARVWRRCGCQMARSGALSYIGTEAHGIGRRDLKIKTYLDEP